MINVEIKFVLKAVFNISVHLNFFFKKTNAMMNSLKTVNKKIIGKLIRYKEI